MFNKKHRVTTLAGIIIVATLALIGCRHPVGYDEGSAAKTKTSTLALTISKAGKRTLIPEGAGGSALTLFPAYTIEFARGASETGTPALPTPSNSTLLPSYTPTEIASVIIEGVEEGYWDITVYGHNNATPNGTTTAAAIGCAENVHITLTGGAITQSIEIELYPFTGSDGTSSVGRGKFAYDITFEGGVTAFLKSGLLKVEPLASPASVAGASPSLPYTIPLAELQPNTTKSWDLPAGMYRVTLMITDELDGVAGVAEIAYVYKNMTTKLFFNCGQDDFMALIVLSGTTMLPPPALTGTGIKPDAALDTPFNFKIRAYYADSAEPDTYHWLLQSSDPTKNYWRTDGSWSMQTPAFKDPTDVFFVLELQNGETFYSKTDSEDDIHEDDVAGIALDFTEVLDATPVTDDTGLITLDNSFLTHNMYLLALDRAGQLEMTVAPRTPSPGRAALNPRIALYYGSPLAVGGTVGNLLAGFESPVETFRKTVEAGTYLALVTQNLTATSDSPIGFELTESFKKATKVSGTITLKYNGVTTYTPDGITVDNAKLHFYQPPSSTPVLDFDGNALVADINPATGAYSAFIPSLAPGAPVIAISPKAEVRLTFADTGQVMPMVELALTATPSFNLGDAPSSSYNGTVHFEYNTVSGAVSCDNPLVDISFFNKVYMLRGYYGPPPSENPYTKAGSADIDGGLYKWRHDRGDPAFASYITITFLLVREEGGYRYYAAGTSSGSQNTDTSAMGYGWSTGSVPQPGAGVYEATLNLVLKTSRMTKTGAMYPDPESSLYNESIGSVSTGRVYLFNTTAGTLNSRALRLKIRTYGPPLQMAANVYNGITLAEFPLPPIDDLDTNASYYVTPIPQAATPYIVLARCTNPDVTTGYKLEAEMAMTSVTLSVTYKPVGLATATVNTAAPSGTVQRNQPITVAIDTWELTHPSESTVDIKATANGWKWYVNGVLQTGATTSTFTTRPDQNSAFYANGGVNTITVEVLAANGNYYGHVVRFNLQQ
jgi:hypothetical protein